MTEQDIKDLGFELVKQYDHPPYNTNRYGKGLIEVEFTYIGKEIETVDATIDEMVGIEISLEDLKLIDNLIHKKYRK